MSMYHQGFRSIKINLLLHHLFLCMLVCGLLWCVAGCERGGSTDKSELPEGTEWRYGRNIADWPVTIRLKSAEMTSISADRKMVTFSYNRLQDIPAWNVPGDPNNVHNVNGVYWLVREFEGNWYIGTVDYLRVGQTTAKVNRAPQFHFNPQPGDRIGFMVSTMARSENGTISGGVTYQERSNVVWTNWPE